MHAFTAAPQGPLTPGAYVEEAQMHRALAGQPRVRQFFQTMRERQAARSKIS